MVICIVFVDGHKRVVGFTSVVCIGHAFNRRRPERCFDLRQLSLILHLYRVLTHVTPHVLMITISCHLQLFQGVLGHELGDDGVPSPPYNRRNRQDVADKQPTTVCVAGEG